MGGRTTLAVDPFDATAANLCRSPQKGVTQGRRVPVRRPWRPAPAACQLIAGLKRGGGARMGQAKP